MSSNPKLAEAVRSVLKTKARAGTTTKQDVILMVFNRIENLGGPTKFGIGAAAMRMAVAHLIETEVTRQFKNGLTAHDREFVLPPTTPPEIVKTLGKVPAWIAIEDRANALWMYALKASANHWRINFSLKERKAQQTIARANESLEIAEFLSKSGYSSLGQMFGIA